MSRREGSDTGTGRFPSFSPPPSTHDAQQRRDDGLPRQVEERVAQAVRLHDVGDEADDLDGEL